MSEYENKSSVGSAIKYEVSLGTAVSTNTETLRHTDRHSNINELQNRLINILNNGCRINYFCTGSDDSYRYQNHDS
jgi:hypothetical protein